MANGKSSYHQHETKASEERNVRTIGGKNSLSYKFRALDFQNFREAKRTLSHTSFFKKLDLQDV